MSDALTLAIDGITHGGDGVGRLDGKAVFVPGALPGETVTVTLTEDRGRFARAALVDVIVAAPERVTPPCAYTQRCGGCDFQHVSAAGHAQLKRRVVYEQLQRIGKIPKPVVHDTVSPTDLTGYRSQIRLHATPEGTLGFYAEHSHTVIPIDRCLIANDAVQQAHAALGDTPGAADVTVRSFDGQQVNVTLTPNGDDPDRFAATLARLDAAGHDTLAINTTEPARVTVGPHTYVAPADAFFQSSVTAATTITDHVLHDVGDVAGRQVADLYAGVGLFTVPLAHAGATVTAVEANRAAAQAAETNVVGYDVTVVADTVERFLKRNSSRFDVVVLDPPRSGAGRTVVDALAATIPTRIVYVACDPAALARDAQFLSQHGYLLAYATPIDAFPMTHHIEVVAVFLPGT